MEALTVVRDASKAVCDALMLEIGAGIEIFGGYIDLDSSLGDGLLD